MCLCVCEGHGGSGAAVVEGSPPPCVRGFQQVPVSGASYPAVFMCGVLRVEDSSCPDTAAVPRFVCRT